MNDSYVFIKDNKSVPIVTDAFDSDMKKYPEGGYCTLINPEPKYQRKWWRRTISGTWVTLDVSDVPKEILTIKLLGEYQ
jgi:hypothetical protein